MATKTTFRFCSLLCCLFSLNLHAAAPFWDESFPGGIPANWTTGDDSPGVAKLWQHCNHFAACPPGNFSNLFFKDERFNALSVDDGYAYLMPYQTTPSFTPHDSWLQTDVIDCAGKDKVFLKFTTYIAALNSNPETDAVVEVQVGGGAWVSFPVFPNLHEDKMEHKGIFSPPAGAPNTFLASFHPQTVWLDLSSEAANESQVRIRWRWKFLGNTEFCWLLDDVELFDENPLHDKAIWGTQAGQGDFAGGLNGWSVSHLGDTCRWRWSGTGLVFYPGSNPLANATGCSPTLSNGVVVVNPTFCQANQSASEYTHTTLTSPDINLSGVAAGTRLALQFHQAINIADPQYKELPIASVAFSTDGGVTYPDTLAALPQGLWGKDACGMQTLGLPSAAAGSAKLKIRFIFSGNAFYWILDDVRILQRHDNDLQVNRLFSAVAPSFSMPKAQVAPMRFLAQVDNLGQAAQDASTLFLTITEDSFQTEVHSDALPLGTLPPGAMISDLPFPKTFMPPVGVNSYTCRYEIKADLPDDDPTNNVVRWKFEVTDTVFRKARNFNAVHAYFRPDGVNRYEVGTVYFIPGNPGKQYAHSVSFSYRGAVDLSTFDKELQVALYKWKTPGSFGDANLDTVANAGEFEQVVMTLHVAKASDDRKLITVPLDPGGDWLPFELEDSTYYFVTVANLTNDFPMFIGGSEEVDYTAMFWLSYQIGLPMFASVLRSGDETEFKANPWALRRIPFIQLNLTSLTPDEEVKTEPIVFEMQPNPASDQFFLTVENGETQRQATVEIFDEAGQLQAKKEFKNTNVSQLAIPVESLRNGFYFVKVTTEAGIGAQKLAVFRK